MAFWTRLDRTRVLDTFRIEELGATVALRTLLPRPAASNTPEAIETLGELEITLSVSFDEPRLIYRHPDSLNFGENGEDPAEFPSFTRSLSVFQLGDSGECELHPDIEDESVYRRQLYRGDGGLEIELFYRFVPPPPDTIIIGDLQVDVAEATIRGLTTDPLVLRGKWAITSQVQHHGPWFGTVFTPLLDPCIPDRQKSELRASGYEILFAYQPSINWFGGAGDGPLG